ncbi:LysR substrate-binding domain-containing protein [Paraburkholderia bannensis]|uniref:LysR substrate-binding domain-containing protein n=1 Tax=Paraburkholderia bannensis TaxID=765414 RepID=UPI002ABE3003|nr:LysR substrate-binding domain-containing protein [Paraburkholderia bannensis]
MTVKNATLRQLKTFETVARRLSFSRAAIELHLSQPAVSTQIKNLEEHAGVALFEQLGKKIFLTDAGKEMARHAREIIDRFNQVEQILAQMKGRSGACLKIGVVTACGYFFPRLIAEFRRRNEGAKLELKVGNRDELLRLLEANEIDLAIMSETPTDSRMAVECFAPQPFVVIAATDHPLARQPRILRAELNGERFVLREQGSDTRSAMESSMPDVLDSLTDTTEIPNTEAIKQAVMAGLGISFLPASAIELEVRAQMLAILDIVGLPVIRQLKIARMTGKSLSPVAQAFRSFLLEEGAALIARPTMGRYATLPALQIAAAA